MLRIPFPLLLEVSPINASHTHTCFEKVSNLHRKNRLRLLCPLLFVVSIETTEHVIMSLPVLLLPSFLPRTPTTLPRMQTHADACMQKSATRHSVLLQQAAECSRVRGMCGLFVQNHVMFLRCALWLITPSNGC